MWRVLSASLACLLATGCVRAGVEPWADARPKDASAHDRAWSDGRTPDAASAANDGADSDRSRRDQLPDRRPTDTAAKPDSGPCFSGPAKTLTLAFTKDYLDLDTGVVHSSSTPPPSVGWDISIVYNALVAVHAVVMQNQGKAVEIAHLPNTAFGSVSSCSVATAPFTKLVVDEPFNTSRVVLVRSDQSKVYKLGLPSETATAVTFSYASLVP